MVLMALVCAEVFKRYILNMPTAWIFDAYEHAVRHAVHDRRRLHAGAERPCPRRFSLQLDAAAHAGRRSTWCSTSLFFLPGIAALLYAGWDYAADSWRIHEHSNVTADGPPVYHFKSMIPLAGALLLLQGVAEIVRCVVCLKTGDWPSRLKDVERNRRGRASSWRTANMSTRSRAGRRSQHAQRHRGGRAAARHGRGPAAMSDPALGLRCSRLIVVVIMMGFPTAFTLMGLGMFFGFFAYLRPRRRPGATTTSST